MEKVLYQWELLRMGKTSLMVSEGRKGSSGGAPSGGAKASLIWRQRGSGVLAGAPVRRRGEP